MSPSHRAGSCAFIKCTRGVPPHLVVAAAGAVPDVAPAVPPHTQRSLIQHPRLRVSHTDPLLRSPPSPYRASCVPQIPAHNRPYPIRSLIYRAVSGLRRHRFWTRVSDLVGTGPGRLGPRQRLAAAHNRAIYDFRAGRAGRSRSSTAEPDYHASCAAPPRSPWAPAAMRRCGHLEFTSTREIDPVPVTVTG